MGGDRLETFSVSHLRAVLEGSEPLDLSTISRPKKIDHLSVENIKALRNIMSPYYYLKNI